jgi:tetratricopeptide (TPR) repeat protein
MKDYTTALAYFEKGLEIREKKLPKNHPRLAVVYHNMAKLYLATGEYNMAMKSVQQALEIAQEKLRRNHPHVVDYKETFEKISKEILN